jgi:hypothetical protein
MDWVTEMTSMALTRTYMLVFFHEQFSGHDFLVFTTKGTDQFE